MNGLLTNMLLGVLVFGVWLLPHCLPAEARERDYEIRHDFSIELGDNEVVRAKWKYHTYARAKLKRGPYERDRKRDTLGPFAPPFADNRTSALDLGGAQATANAQIDFTATGGFHQVDGVAKIADNGSYARAYSKSVVGLNAGVKDPRGRIRWKPRWIVDKISDTAVVGDPVDLTIRDLDSDLQLSGTLFEVLVHLGSGGSGSWEQGHISLNGVDGSFFVKMESPYLTTPQGSMLLTFDAQGIVTRSEDSGIFGGLLPQVGQPASLDMRVGDADGNIDLAFDFENAGASFGDNLDLSGELGGDGLSLVVADSGDTIQDFSITEFPDTSRPLLGTGYAHGRTGSDPGPTLLHDPSGDVFDGFLRLASQSEFQQNSIAFDRTSHVVRDSISAEFDFRIVDENGDGGQADGLSFALIPTDLYGDSGPLEVEEGYFAEEPNLMGSFGVGFDTYDNSEEDCPDCLDSRANHVSLHWDGNQVSDLRVLDIENEIDFVNGAWNTATIEIEQLDEDAYVSLSVTDGTDGSVHTVFEQELIEGMSIESARVAFAARTGAYADHHDIDNVFVTFGDFLSADFNVDGDVDGDDFLIWQAGFNAFQGNATRNNGDANGDGFVDGDDFLSWQADFGSGTEAGGSAAVPEPSALVLCLVGLLAAVSPSRAAV